MLATVLLGLGAGAELAPGVIWVLALFANVLAVEGVFRRDHDDGTLEQLLIHARPLFPAVMGKLAAHWALSGLPVAVLSPVAAIMLTGTTNGVGVLVLSLCIGTPALTLLGAIGSALTVATGRGGLLVAILVLPFYVPVLIFGASASTAAMLGDPVAFQLLALAALLAASLTARRSRWARRWRSARNTRGPPVNLTPLGAPMTARRTWASRGGGARQTA